MYSVSYNGINIEYEVIRRKRKTLAIRIAPNGNVEAIVPLFLDNGMVEDIVKKKAEWICDKLNAIKASRKSAKKRVWDKEMLMYLGKEITLRLIEVPKKDITITFDGNDIALFINKKINEAIDRDEYIKRTLVEWYRKRAGEKLMERTKVFSKIMGLSFNRVFIKEQKTRWGSCSSKGNINYNWKLIMAPEAIIDYVVVHELAHIKHPNHSKEFWKFVENFLPDYRERENWLKANGSKLEI